MKYHTITITEISQKMMRRSFDKTVYQFRKILSIKFHGSFGIYVHVPFCNTRCSLCPFHKELCSRGKKDLYLKAILSEIISTDMFREARWVYFGGASPMLHDLFRARGGTDILLGYTFTPYDTFAYNTGNLIGDNIAFGVTGFLGLELFTGERTSIYFDAGGGFKMHTGNEENPYVIASSWLGSGFMLRVGMTFYR